MIRDDSCDAAAWRAIRLAGRPLVQLETASPRQVIRLAHARLREMRLKARMRGAQNDNGEGGNVA